MSWGHDEYLYQLVKDHLPDPALYMIRYHSFYSWHREQQYGQLTDARDRANLPWVASLVAVGYWASNQAAPENPHRQKAMSRLPSGSTR